MTGQRFVFSLFDVWLPSIPRPCRGPDDVTQRLHSADPRAPGLHLPGSGGQHWGPEGGGHPSVSGMLPPSYSPAISPTHHLPPYLAHPHFIPNSHTAFYPPVSPGDMPPHQYYQHHLPPMYSEEIIPVYGMSSYIGREEQYSKPQPKKTKERQLERQNRLNSPPSSVYKSGGGGCTATHNGYGKSHGGGVSAGGGGGGAGSPGIKKTDRRARSSPRASEPGLQVRHHCSRLTPAPKVLTVCLRGGQSGGGGRPSRLPAGRLACEGLNGTHFTAGPGSCSHGFRLPGAARAGRPTPCDRGNFVLVRERERETESGRVPFISRVK
ncbi:hypothetical protein AAFF_G00230210 [Aldrovandia affinis]|uniref:Uncharacterized protein n=1 Tax=Aldrovandia affinis TaxID=143900 RepID=A0AAD7WUM5_9TELE|nr:hypothetical protein AAFF_G00230210 [Aldrovandia affinis]